MTNLSLASDNQSPQASSQPAELRVLLTQIRRNPNIDPRKGRNKAKYAAIRASIREEGVMQPILIRPIDGAAVPYEVVAGNTRYDASVEENKIDIPVIIREMTDKQARQAAAIENVQRSDLTPIEEAYNAVQLLEDANNDHDEVCRALGWGRSKLDARVLLSKCCSSVAEALVQGDIKLGHAELLAPMTEELQASVCAAIIERKMTVTATRDRLLEMTASIASARFDVTECGTCQHNSAQYGDLFRASLGDAKCQNHACWEQKTANLIEVKLIEAQQDYGVVHTDMTLPTDGYVLLEERGPNGVGATQFSACTACANYGAVVSTKQGNEGTIVGGHCFNKTCHSEHNGAYKQLIAQATATPTVAQPQGSGAVQQGTASTKASAASASAGKTSTAKPQEVKKAIKKEAFALFSQMGAQAISANRAYALAISIVSLYLDMRSDLPAELTERLHKSIGFPKTLGSFDRAPFELVLAAKPVEELERFLSQLAACTVFRRDSTETFQKSTPGAQSIGFIKAAGMDPVDHFRMSEGYLKALTKAGIVGDCKASGFDMKYDEVKGDKEFAKLVGGKVDDLIKAILGFEEFSWKGYLPETMKISAYDGSGTV